MSDKRGFTLVELLITLAILGILVTVAVPAYQGQMERSRRADGKGALMDIAARLERHMAQNNTYTIEVSGASGLNMGTVSSPEGFYEMEVEACDGGAISRCYSVSATAGGTQAGDTDCAVLTLASTGAKSAFNHSDVVNGECW